MKETNYFPAPGGAYRAGRIAATLALLLVAGCMTSLPCAAQQFLYKGIDAAYPNITMSLTLTKVGANYAATGQIYMAGHFNFQLNPGGELMGTLLRGTVNFSCPYSTVCQSNVFGNLVGVLGTGPILVSTGPLPVSVGSPIGLAFMLHPQVPTTQTITQPPYHPPVLPTSVHMTGGTGFGYTSVTLTLDLALKGSSYDVSGTIFVKQYDTCALVPSCTPHYIDTTLDVSGVLTPGVRGNLNISGAPGGNNPQFNGTIGATGTTFQSFLSGLPTLGISGLYIDASQ